MVVLGWDLSAGLTKTFSTVAALPGEMFTTKKKGASSIAGIIESPPVTSVVWL